MLRRDVKQIVLSRDALSIVRHDLAILDERSDGERIAIVVEKAERALEIVGREGIEHRIVDLNLDEIFEAYVAGRRTDAPVSGVKQAELQPLV
jgi:hypothetical protein